jgi:hypothetical protein
MFIELLFSFRFLKVYFTIFYTCGLEVILQIILKDSLVRCLNYSNCSFYYLSTILNSRAVYILYGCLVWSNLLFIHGCLICFWMFAVVSHIVATALPSF